MGGDLMKKQTAVEWLALYIKGITNLNCDEVIDQAKAMEKEHFFKVFRSGFINGNLIETEYFNDNKEELIKSAFKSFENYYEL
jgi:hypothetical protein